MSGGQSLDTAGTGAAEVDLKIRPERATDVVAITRVHEAAFGKPGEARIVTDVRETDRFVRELSLVATEGPAVVGHVLLSHVDLIGEAGVTRVLQLGPIAVLPERQRRGIGSALMRAAIAAAGGRGEPLIAVLGDPRYYGRFGFRPSRELGIEPPPGDPPAYFMVLPLGAHAATVRGTVRYSAAFTDNT